MIYHITWRTFVTLGSLQPEMLERLISPLEAHEISADDVDTYFIIP